MDEVHEVCLEPLAGLRGVLGGVGSGAHHVEARAIGIGRAVRLSRRFDPPVGVNAGRGVGARALAEAGAVDVAPVAPLVADVALAVAGGGGDGR